MPPRPASPRLRRQTRGERTADGPGRRPGKPSRKIREPRFFIADLTATSAPTARPRQPLPRPDRAAAAGRVLPSATCSALRDACVPRCSRRTSPEPPERQRSRSARLLSPSRIDPVGGRRTSPGPSPPDPSRSKPTAVPARSPAATRPRASPAVILFPSADRGWVHMGTAPPRAVTRSGLAAPRRPRRRPGEVSSTDNPAIPIPTFGAARQTAPCGTAAPAPARPPRISRTSRSLPPGRPSRDSPGLPGMASTEGPVTAAAPAPPSRRAGVPPASDRWPRPTSNSRRDPPQTLPNFDPPRVLSRSARGTPAAGSAAPPPTAEPDGPPASGVRRPLDLRLPPPVPTTIQPPQPARQCPALKACDRTVPALQTEADRRCIHPRRRRGRATPGPAVRTPVIRPDQPGGKVQRST
jgi:hypothetical protein